MTTNIEAEITINTEHGFPSYPMNPQGFPPYGYPMNPQYAVDQQGAQPHPGSGAQQSPTGSCPSTDCPK
jgi:hypothetical protein